MDLTVVFDRFFRRQLLWEQYSCALHEYRGECVLVAVQFLYNDVQTMRGKSQSTHIRTSSEAIVSGVKQDCPLSPTLFGVFVDALECQSYRAAAMLRQQPLGSPSDTNAAWRQPSPFQPEACR